MGRSNHCTDQSSSYKSPHSNCETRPLGECYAALLWPSTYIKYAIYSVASLIAVVRFRDPPRIRKSAK
ncbi:hypothetical protein SK128_026993 [Halocaridina rubra]|uniref:Uncharacterized protein n=1 Tax=Halocaridina rubra TaxID=373956 RepID=A0AAN9AAV2_HALRR